MKPLFEADEAPRRANPTTGAALETLCWYGTIAGCGIGLFILITGMMSATGAPQEAVVCALAVACCVIPYCTSRAVHHIRTIS